LALGYVGDFIAGENVCEPAKLDSFDPSVLRVGLAPFARRDSVDSEKCRRRFNASELFLLNFHDESGSR
jgi:hypothetical protein